MDISRTLGTPTILYIEPEDVGRDAGACRKQARCRVDAGHRTYILA
jgi:hypothetical protein